MKKTNLTLKEICEKTFSTFETRGYRPKFLNDDRTEFGCLINGISFSFCLLEDDLFWFGAEFELDQEISAVEWEALEKIYMQILPEDVVFENLHVDGDEVCLSSAFPADFYEEELIELVIKTLESTDGITAQLRTMLKK